jgi:hypothetical protein
MPGDSLLKGKVDFRDRNLVVMHALVSMKVFHGPLKLIF